MTPTDKKVLNRNPKLNHHLNHLQWHNHPLHNHNNNSREFWYLKYPNLPHFMVDLFTFLVVIPWFTVMVYI